MPWSCTTAPRSYRAGTADTDSRVETPFSTRGEPLLDPTSDRLMKEHEFVCQDCGQQIEVNEPVQQAILENGCPVCSAPASPDDFS